MAAKGRKAAPSKMKTRRAPALEVVRPPVEESTSGHGAASALDILRRRQQSRDELKLPFQAPSVRK
jgi:hypothetical protein